MDISSAIWLTELQEMDNPDLNLIQEYLHINDTLEESFDSFAANSLYTSDLESSYSAYPSLSSEINGITSHNSIQSAAGFATKLRNELKPSTSYDASPKAASRTRSSSIICFANSKEENPNDALEFSDGAVVRGNYSCSNRSPVQAQEHVLNERKRRERMTKQFVALSAIIPNKKKMDKASILGEATKYIKELQGRVKELENEEQRKYVDSTICSVKRVRFSGDTDDLSSSEENSPPAGHFNFSPEIEVRVSEANVLVKIHCHKHCGFIVKALNEIQKNHLTVISSNAMPFANSTLLINIIAKMEDDFLMTANELVEKLQLAIFNFK